MVHWREEFAVSVHREDELEAGDGKETGSCCKVKFGKTAVPYIGRIAAKGDHFIVCQLNLILPYKTSQFNLAAKFLYGCFVILWILNN